jgi:hypothetical protein
LLERAWARARHRWPVKGQLVEWSHGGRSLPKFWAPEQDRLPMTTSIPRADEQQHLARRAMKQWQELKTEGWFTTALMDSWLILTPAPTVAEVAIKKLCEAKHIYPWCSHIFICPAIMTSHWMKQLSGSEDRRIRCESWEGPNYPGQDQREMDVTRWAKSLSESTTLVQPTRSTMQRLNVVETNVIGVLMWI